MLLVVSLSIDQIVRITIRIVTRAHLSILTEQHVSQMQTASSSTLINDRAKHARSRANHIPIKNRAGLSRERRKEKH